MSRRTLFSIALLLAFCASASATTKSPYVESKNQTLAPPPADKAQIVFLEPINSLQGQTPVGIFEIEGDNRTLLAITGGRSKVALLFNPGHHILMANQAGLKSHFLEANVEAGKRYYVLVRFVYAFGFQLRPIRPSGPSDYTVANKDFPTWISQTHFVEKTVHGDSFFAKVNKGVIKSQAEDWKIWLNKTPQEREDLTLNPGDAVAD